jgi:peptide/nickel transport system ATP-binding protein/oligopeptide transport system ATP-binding protein
VLGLSPDERRRLRGGKMSMIFQEPMTSLNPVHTIGQQIVEAILAHTQLSPQQAKARAIEMLELVQHPLGRRRASTTSASPVGRHAPARHDRHGARLRALRC